MEINQKLFDECTQNYKIQRQKEKELFLKRDDIWNKIEEVAASNPNYNVVGKPSDPQVYTPPANEEGADINDIISYEKQWSSFSDVSLVSQSSRKKPRH